MTKVLSFANRDILFCSFPLFREISLFPFFRLNMTISFYFFINNIIVGYLKWRRRNRFIIGNFLFFHSKWVWWLKRCYEHKLHFLIKYLIKVSPKQYSFWLKVIQNYIFRLFFNKKEKVYHYYGWIIKENLMEIKVIQGMSENGSAGCNYEWMNLI